MRTSDVGLLCMSSTTKFGASVDEFRNPEMLVMLRDTPVGILTCIQLPITKSIGDDCSPDLIWRDASAEPLGFLKFRTSGGRVQGRS